MLFTRRHLLAAGAALPLEGCASSSGLRYASAWSQKGQQAGDIRLNYVEDGAGDAVLLLHGQGGHGADWASQVEALRAQYRVVAPDLRGHGESTVTPGPYHMGMLAGDVALLCAGLGLSRVHVVGHSLGGMVALQLALDHPQLVRSLSILNSTAFGDGSVLRTTAVKLVIRTRGMPAFASLNNGMHFPDKGQEALQERLLVSMGTTPADGYLGAQAAVDAFDVRARLGEISCPTLVVHSDQDVIPLEDKQLLVARVKHGTLVTVANSRHVVIWDQPDKVNALLVDFLGGSAAGDVGGQ